HPKTLAGTPSAQCNDGVAHLAGGADSGTLEFTHEKELVVFWVRPPAPCADCATSLERGSLLRLESGRALCLACADLDHLEYLPRGDAALTRRARRYSTLHAVAVEWSRSRQRYERQGLLVEPAALERAEAECLADAEVRLRRRQQNSIRS